MAGSPEGAPCWVVAMLPDAAAGRRFYGELFGWTFVEPHPETDAADVRAGADVRADAGAADRHGYTVALLDGRPVAGLLAKPDGRMPTEWLLHLATEDVTAAVGRVRAAGGQVMTEPFALGDAGVTAVAADPGGAVFQLWQPGLHDGFEARGEPGAYAWAEVFTRDAEAADAFYASVFGFGGTDLSAALGEDYLMWTPRNELVDEEHAIGGRCLLDDRYPAEMPAHFRTYFAVRDCDEAVRTAERLGGRTLLGPEDSPYGRNALLVDNQGATFAVLTTEDAGAPDGAA
ncbi:VOC family protein [Streptomyces sp. NPDC054784]